MANTVAPLNPEVWKYIIQDYLNNRLVARAICNTKCEELLKDGDQVNFPEVTDVRVQSYSQGTDLTIDEFTATQSSLVVNQSKAATFPLDQVQEKQARANYGMELASQSAYVLANNIDQTVLNTGVSGANDTVTGGTLSVSNILAKLSDARAQLERNNAADAELFAVMDPDRVALLQQNFVANGFQTADMHLRNYFSGKYLGFNVYQSNNLPTTQTLTVDTQPANGESITIAGVTFNLVTDGTAASAGDVNIGADLADFKLILVDAINNGTSKTSDWVDVSTDDRRKLQNAQVTAAAFATNDMVVTAFKKIGGAETMATATNIWGTETTQILTGRQGAISLAIQMYPNLTIAQEPKQLVKNYITHTLYGTKVFSRDAYRLVKLTHNM